MKYILSDSVAMTRTDYGYVILDTRKSKYFQVNAVAGEMLKLLASGRCVSDVAQSVADTYDIPGTRVLRDLEALISEALGACIIEQVSE
ncbi:hypothetical protein Sked_14510 [Sanguibacter keddieii DSM 10542]|uniref:Coenzyme PQQ synthesis protein D (PqqD) n=2 Tax=Sanguibacter keddieii TaxID=60920 RepID=D1BF91_SANKS|nr:PqqD family peptide modification chaperone [Sanguibacter keddieii]ACZ21387.1 hypothetical protein Sked_14510 [Sanguibacter keddieii DSM 10542]QBN22643.1 coenzyme PQQ synthesis protein D [Sanguibacter keddieii]